MKMLVAAGIAIATLVVGGSGAEASGCHRIGQPPAELTRMAIQPFTAPFFAGHVEQALGPNWPARLRDAARHARWYENCPNF